MFCQYYPYLGDKNYYSYWIIYLLILTHQCYIKTILTKVHLNLLKSCNEFFQGPKAKRPLFKHGSWDINVFFYYLLCNASRNRGRQFPNRRPWMRIIKSRVVVSIGLDTLKLFRKDVFDSNVFVSVHKSDWYSNCKRLILINISFTQ